MKITMYFTRFFWALVLSLMILQNSHAQENSSKAKAKKVFILEIKSEIDPRTERYVNLGLEAALAEQADYLLVEMNTFGGRVDNADVISQALQDFALPSLVFINKNAASAGAWIAISCDSIYMAPGASIGAATVVTGQGEAAPDKYQSYMRSRMRATAEAQGRDPRIAEAMVDQTLEVPEVIEAGKVLTFTTSEALKYDFCDAEAQSLEDVLRLHQLEDAEVVRFELDATEKIVNIFLNPALSSILLLVILGGIYFELQSPGLGFPIVAAFIAAILYFIPYYLVGLAAYWELALFLVGVLLLAAEVFIIPGFGVAGISGLILTFSSLVLMMLNNDGLEFRFVLPEQINQSLTSVGLAFVGAIALMFFVAPSLLQTRYFRKVTLQGGLNTPVSYSDNGVYKNLVGKTGITQTVMRPSGKVLIDGTLYDAYSQREFIEANTPIVVLSQEGSSLAVAIKKQKNSE